MPAAAPGNALPPHCFPCYSKSGKRRSFADKWETGSKQPTITQQKSHRPPRLLPLPNPPPGHPSGNRQFAAPQPPQRGPAAPRFPLGSRPLFLPGRALLTLAQPLHLQEPIRPMATGSGDTGHPVSQRHLLQPLPPDPGAAEPAAALGPPRTSGAASPSPVT